jgi:hypothetical protein
MTRNHDNEHQKANELNAEERKSNGYESIGLHVRHVHQRLNDARNQNSDA